MFERINESLNESINTHADVWRELVRADGVDNEELQKAFMAGVAWIDQKANGLFFFGRNTYEEARKEANIRWPISEQKDD